MGIRHRVTGVRFVMLVWLASRAFFLAVGAIAARTIDHADVVGVQFEALGPLGYWARWDGAWYAFIATDGYAAHAPNATGFFPAYPLLLRPATWLGDFVALAGVVVSTIALLAALWFLYRIAEDGWGEAAARASVLALAFFPTAFFLNAVYTESLFLAFATGSVWLARVRRDAIVGGILGGCASITRHVGVFLVVPLLYEWVRRRRLPWYEAAFGTLLILWGIGAYMLYLYRAFGDPLIFTDVQQRVWRRGLANPLETIADGARAAADGLDLAIRPWTVLQTTSANPPFELTGTTNFVFLVAALALLVVAALRLPPGLSVYAALAVVAPLLSPDAAFPLLGVPRYVLAAFPLFIALGLLLAKRPALQVAYVTVCAVVGAYLTALFTTWRWVS